MPYLFGFGLYEEVGGVEGVSVEDAGCDRGGKVVRGVFGDGGFGDEQVKAVRRWCCSCLSLPGRSRKCRVQGFLLLLGWLR